jgi:hypothetical protein
VTKGGFKMQFIIYPYRGVNSLEFGMSFEEVRRNLDSEFESNYVEDILIPHHKRQSEPRILESDSFEDIGIIPSYSRTGKCHSVFIFNSEGDSTEAILNGINLLSGWTIEEAKKWLETTDKLIEIGGTEIISHKYGIALIINSYEHCRNDILTEIVVFQDGYYDKPC